jgi:hypothetical protein
MPRSDIKTPISLALVFTTCAILPGCGSDRPPADATQAALIECGPCLPDPSSPSGASQICKIGESTVKRPCRLDEPPPPTRGDDDRDGLQDAYEDRLLLEFSPRIWLSHYENRWPVSVEWLLSRSTLRYSHARCSDHGLLALGNVTVANITEQGHRNARDPLNNWPWNWCKHYGPVNRSDRYTAVPKKSYFLQFLDAAHEGSTRHADWVVYGHVYPVSTGIVIQYWQLYAFNDSFASANHEGDWEYTAVLIDRQEVPQGVVFFRHGHAHEVAPSAVEWNGKHHITYSSKGGHAQYRGAAVNGCVDADWQGFADTCSPGTAWNTWEPAFGGIVNVGEKNFPLNNANWLRYSGLWGEIGTWPEVGVRFTSGPPGPAYQPDNWNRGK